MIFAAIPVAFAVWAGGAIAIDQAVNAHTAETVAVEQIEIVPVDITNTDIVAYSE